MANSTGTLSPCINVCIINAETGFCLGCYRTRGEISEWPQLAHAEKIRIIADLKERETEDKG